MADVSLKKLKTLNGNIFGVVILYNDGVFFPDILNKEKWFYWRYNVHIPWAWYHSMGIFRSVWGVHCIIVVGKNCKWKRI